MTLGKWPIVHGKESVVPVDHYATEELLIVNGTIYEPARLGNRKVRIEFKGDKHGEAAAHELIDILQRWIWLRRDAETERQSRYGN